MSCTWLRWAEKVVKFYWCNWIRFLTQVLPLHFALFTKLAVVARHTMLLRCPPPGLMGIFLLRSEPFTDWKCLFCHTQHRQYTPPGVNEFITATLAALHKVADACSAKCCIVGKKSLASTRFSVSIAPSLVGGRTSSWIARGMYENCTNGPCPYNVTIVVLYYIGGYSTWIRLRLWYLLTRA